LQRTHGVFGRPAVTRFTVATPTLPRPACQRLHEAVTPTVVVFDAFVNERRCAVESI